MATATKYKKQSISKTEAKEVEKNLEDLMLAKKSYLNPTLTLHDLAELVDVKTNTLSQILNEQIGKNFYDYVNSFRLEHFLELKDSNKYEHLTILALAYESVCNSQTTFNAFFTRLSNSTPSAYFNTK